MVWPIYLRRVPKKFSANELYFCWYQVQNWNRKWRLVHSETVQVIIVKMYTNDKLSVKTFRTVGIDTKFSEETRKKTKLYELTM